MFGGRLGITELLLLLVLLSPVWVLVIVAWWRIFSRAGHQGILGLMMVIPVLRFIVLLWFAFSEWPIEKSLAAGAITRGPGQTPIS
jgi:hypothetical protein